VPGAAHRYDIDCVVSVPVQPLISRRSRRGIARVAAEKPIDVATSHARSQ